MDRKKGPGHEDSVFVNCPFDEEYEELFDAIVFAVHDCGFVARCALEAIDSGRLASTRFSQLSPNMIGIGGFCSSYQNYAAAFILIGTKS